MKVYIAGPMTGLPEFNYPAFNKAAEQLRARGYEVLNPADNKPAMDDPTWLDWMRLALSQLIQADEVVMLPGWDKSRGATVEYDLAHALGLGVNHLSELTSVWERK